MTLDLSQPHDATDRVTREGHLARDLALPDAKLEQVVPALEEWLSQTERSLSPSLSARYSHLRIGADDYAADELHWELYPQDYLSGDDPSDGGRRAPEERVSGSLYHRGDEIISIGARESELGTLCTVQCHDLTFYPAFAGLARHLRRHFGGYYLPPLDLRDEFLPDSLRYHDRLEVRLRTDIHTLYAWLVREAARSVGWVETEVVGFYQHEFRLARATGLIMGTWRYIRALSTNAGAVSRMVEPAAFLQVWVTEHVDATTVVLWCEDARFRALCLRLVASALREFPVDAASAEQSSQYDEWAESIQQHAPVRTLASEVMGPAGDAVARVDGLGETMRVRLTAWPKEYHTWLTSQAREGGLLAKYEMVQWDRDHLLLRAHESIVINEGPSWIDSENEVTRPVYAASLVLAPVGEGEAGTVLTIRYLSDSGIYLQDVAALTEASLRAFDGCRLASRQDTPEAGSPAQYAPSTAKKGQTPQRMPTITDDVWLAAKVYAQILKENPRQSHGQIAARANRVGEDGHRTHDRHRVRYVCNKMKAAYGDEWWNDMPSDPPE
jgi:hypothetical protein